MGCIRSIDTVNQLMLIIVCDTKHVLSTLSALPMQVDMHLLTDPWQNLEHATQGQLADLKLQTAVKQAVKDLHAINHYRHGDIRKPNLMFR